MHGYQVRIGSYLAERARYPIAILYLETLSSVRLSVACVPCPRIRCESDGIAPILLDHYRGATFPAVRVRDAGNPAVLNLKRHARRDDATVRLSQTDGEQLLEVPEPDAMAARYYRFLLVRSNGPSANSTTAL